MIRTIKKLVFACSKKLRRKIYFIIFILFINALLEFLNIVLIASVLLLFTDPDKITTFINNFNFFLNIDIRDLTKTLSLMVVLIAVLSGILRTYCVNKISNVSAEIGSFLNVRLFRNIIYQEVLEYYNLDKNKVFHSTNNTNIAINTIIQPIFMIFMGSFSFLLIAFGTLAFAPFVTFTILSIIIILYLMLTLVLKKRLLNLSNDQNNLNKKELSIIKDSLELFKEIKLKNNQEFFLSIFEKIDKKLRNKIAKVISISLTPRFIFESVGISLIGLSAFFATILNKEESLLPTLGIILLAMQRLIPSAQQVYSSYTNAKGSIFALDNLLKPDFIEINDEYISKLRNISRNKKSRLKTFNSIELKEVYASYGDSKKNIINGINLKINKGDKVGIIGQTGSGKSSLIDLLMTLTKPVKGEVLFNENIINFDDQNSLNKIRDLISYVPQTVYLKNSSIRNNIIFNNENSKNNDEKRLRTACDISCVTNFSRNFRDGLDHIVGDNGSFLSGGQKQRVAIARSIYSNDKILVFDEATSGLDQETEYEILHNFTHKLSFKTIILITHRPASLVNFNKIIILNKGMIEEIGSFNYLKNNSTRFQRLLKINS